MASIEKRGENWRVRWRTLGGCARSRRCSDRETARQLVRDIEGALALGRDWSPAAAPSAVPGVAGCVQDWLNDRARSRSPLAVRRQVAEMEVFVRWAERECPTIGDLSKDVLARYHSYLQTERTEAERVMESGRRWTRKVRCSQRTANGRIVDLQVWWRWLSDHDEYGPLTPRPRIIELPHAEPEKQNPAATWEEMDAVVAACRMDWHRRCTWVCRCTGLRIWQVVRLRWDDLDLAAATLRIRPELGKSRGEKRGRVVPVAPVLLVDLQRWERRGESITGAPWPMDRGSQAAAIRRAGVDPRPWYRAPWHGFRSGFQTGIVGQRGDLAEAVKFLVGHSRGTQGGYVPGLQAGSVEAVRLVPEFRPPMRLRLVPRP